MNNHRESSSSRNAAGAGTPARAGVVETIAEGFSVALARPWLLAIPLLSDLVLWLGLQISTRSLTESLGRLMIEQGGANGQLAADELAKIGERAHVNDMGAFLIPSLFSGIARDSLLAGLFSIIAPPLTRGIERGKMYGDWGRGLVGEWSPDKWFGVLGLMAAFLLFSTVLLVIFQVPLADAIRHEHRGARRLARAMVMAWGRIIGLFVLAGIAGGIVFIPLTIGVAVLLLLGIDLTALLSFLILIGGGVLAVYTFFVLNAIVVSEVGPITAVRYSVAIVRRNFADTLRFGGTSLLIATGSLQIWRHLIENPPGIVLSLLGNAFIGTGLVLASMLFYSDRLRVWQQNPRGGIRRVFGPTHSRS